jgi:nicotinamide riboside transporter PnuC
MNIGIEGVSVGITAIAVWGVILNNRRNRFCFYLWLVSNTLSLAVHVVAGLWGLALRDLIFLVLAVEGLRKWRAKT